MSSINIPDSVTSIGDRAFLGCNGLSSINIPNTVTSIGDRAFEYTGFSENEIEQIYSYINEKGPKEKFKTFVHQTPVEARDSSTGPEHNEEDETAPESPLSNTVYLYNGNQDETVVHIPNTFTAIGNGAFKRCSGLIAIEIPSSIKSIGWHAFKGCTGITAIEIPSSVTSIRKSAFLKCSGLKNAAILGTGTTISWPLFKGCQNLKKLILKSNYYVIENGLVYNRARTELFEFIPSLSKSDTIKIDDKVQTIHSSAFYNLKSIKSIELPRFLRRIEHRAFDFASSKVQLILNTDNLAQIKLADDDSVKPSFLNIPHDCSLVVPIGSGYAYRHHPVWGQFQNITTAPIDWDAEK